MDEFDSKQDRMHRLLADRGLEGLLLRRVSSFAWATCGAASYVNTASTYGESSLLVTPKGRYLITNNIEAARLEDEEGVATQGWEPCVSPWHEGRDVVSALVPEGRLGADSPHPGAVDLSPEVARLRAELTPEEGQRFRSLGGLCAEAVDAATRAVRPGQSEHVMASLLAGESESRGVQAIVNLIATDERVYRFRHPLPTAKTLERYAMLVLCGRKGGLVCSVTRLVYFGRLPDDLKRKRDAVARVDASLIAATRPGSTLGEVLARGIRAYQEAGFPEEWRHHHQGGPVGYEPREWLATPDSPDVVVAGQAFAWNPSIQGTKSEDTILAGETQAEILTETAGWPLLPLAVDGQTIMRPAILEVT
jgi:antitoxin VapB